MNKKRKPYSQRTDEEKLASNWNKSLGLYNDKQYSMAIVRAATCIEIAANIVIRDQLIRKRGLDKDFVDSLLKWANGLDGKFRHLIYPIFHGKPECATYKKTYKQIEPLHKFRNEVAHGGHFARRPTANHLLIIAHEVCAFLAPQAFSKFEMEKPEKLREDGTT